MYIINITSHFFHQGKKQRYVHCKIREKEETKVRMSLDERTNAQAAAEPVHEDFIPPSDWDRQQNSDTLILMLPGSVPLVYALYIYLKMLLKLIPSIKLIF